MGRLMIWGLVIILMAASVAWLTRRVLGPNAGLLLAAVPGGLFCWVLSRVPAISSSGPVVESTPWVPSLGVNLSFRFDGLSVLFLLLIFGIGTLILVYSAKYLAKNALQGRFFGFVLFFLAAMAGMVSSENLLLLFVFWELTGVASFFLIGFDHAKEESRKSALRALLITGAGGLALLAGIVLIGAKAGSFELTEIFAKRELLVGDPLYPAMLALILAGAMAKSAQFPFHFWLPGAMAAPSPVSALLHSATMVKAGVFLLARLFPALGATEQWHLWVSAVGVTTMVVGISIAVGQTDLKRLLAYSTVSALGTLTFLLGIGTKEAHKAAVVFLIVHATYKAALFMAAGSIDHALHTRDVRRLGGLAREMPFTAFAAIIAALSMCGLPPMLGFLGKELLYEAKMQAPPIFPFILAAGVFANVLTVAVAIIVGLRPFLRTKREDGLVGHEYGWQMWIGPVLLGLVSLAAGAMPGLIQESLVRPALEAIRSEELSIKLKLWHGINPVLLLSIATVMLGCAVYFGIGFVRSLRSRMSKGAPWLRGSLMFDLGLKGILAGGAWLTRITQHGYLRGYVMVVMLSTAALVVWSFFSAGNGLDWLPAQLARAGEAPLPFILLVLIMCAAAVSSLFFDSRLAVLCCFGIVGFGVALLFAWHGAPDLALTQVLVEAITLILMLLVICKLPRFANLASRGGRVRDLVLSGFVGLLFTLLALNANRVETHTPISSYFVENSPAAQGRNVVNVILVDFRALDTMGEIIVLALAALGAAAVLARQRGPQRKTVGRIR